MRPCQGLDCAVQQGGKNKGETVFLIHFAFAGGKTGCRMPYGCGKKYSKQYLTGKQKFILLFRKASNGKDNQKQSQ